LGDVIIIELSTVFFLKVRVKIFTTYYGKHKTCTGFFLKNILPGDGERNLMVSLLLVVLPPERSVRNVPDTWPCLANSRCMKGSRIAMFKTSITNTVPGKGV